MSELVEDAIASKCGDIVEHFWLVRNGVEKPLNTIIKILNVLAGSNPNICYN